MPTATLRAPLHTPALSFVLRGVVWSLAFFGLIRLGWFEAHAVVPVTAWQARLAAIGFGAPALPMSVTLECSGADALALCAAAIFAYPVAWRMRIVGAAGGVALIVALNTVRIGTLGRAIASPASFNALHVYVWPALLTLTIGAYVFSWMHVAGRSSGTAVDSRDPVNPQRRVTAERSGLTWQFVAWAAALVALFVAAAPLYLESTRVLAIAGFIARAAAWMLGRFGVQASAASNVLWTTRGAFLVTQECVSTPLIPVYFAAVGAYATTWRGRAIAIVAAAPLFVGLGIARLLVVALPATLITSPLFVVHAFYQLLLAAVLVCLAAVWRHGTGTTAGMRALAGVVLGGGCVWLFGGAYARALAAIFVNGTALEDPQGAMALLPAFQIGMYVALAVAVFVAFRWRAFAAGLALLAVSQLAVLAALTFLANHVGLTPHVRDVRAWALAAPLVIVAALVTSERARH